MIPIDRVIKNQDLTSNKLQFEEMNIHELEYYYNRFKKMKNNEHLLNSLKDKGEKIKHQLEIIEKLIVKKFKDENNVELKTEIDVNEANVDKLLDDFKTLNLLNANNKSQSKNEKVLAQIDAIDKEKAKKEENYKDILDKRFQKLIDKIDDEIAKNELLKDLNSKDNLDKINEKRKENNDLNYFLLKSSSTIENKKVIQKKDLNDVKKKIIEKYRAKEEASKVKTIPLNESLILVQEQSKRLQELQMQQAAQKLLQGSQLKNYDYSNVDKISDKSRYRNRDEDEIEDFNENYDDDNDSNDSDSDFENFGRNYESYNAKKLSIFKQTMLNNKNKNRNGEENNDVDHDHDEENDELDKVD